MEQRDVKLRVELEVVGGQPTDSTSPSAPSNPAAPASPGTVTPDAGAGRGTAPPPSLAPGQYPSTTPGTSPEADLDPSDPRSTRDEEIEQRVTQRVRKDLDSLARSAMGGGGRMSDGIVNIAAGFAAPIPGAAGAIRAAEFAERYGAAALAAASSLLPPETRKAIQAAQGTVEGISREIASVRATFDAFGSAADETASMAAAQVVFGGATDPAFLAKFARNSYERRRRELEVAAAVTQFNRQALGQAGGDILTQLIAGEGSAR